MYYFVVARTIILKLGKNTEQNGKGSALIKLRVTHPITFPDISKGSNLLNMAAGRRLQVLIKI